MKYFNFKKLFSDTKKVIIIVACALLLIGNIAVFAYLSASMMLPSFLIIVLSNIITILLTFAIYKPINNIIEEEIQERIHEETSAQVKLQEENHELLQQKKHMEDVAIQREQKIKTLESELETARQYKSISNNANTVLKLETMEYEKEGYIVKEEYVRDTNIGRDIEQDSKWALKFKDKDKGEQKVLYINHFHEKAIIGIDIAKIRFCRHDGLIYLEGVKVENLHQEMTLRNDDDNQYQRCMILNMDQDEPISLNNASKYDFFKHDYQHQQKDLLTIEFEQEVRSICRSYTDVIKNNLTNKFSTIRFVDDKIENAIDLAGEPIFQLNTSRDLNILEVSSSIVMIANTIHQTMPLVKK
ncbi:MAG: hypothetical protein K6F33_11410 [Bacteroidales bacterium]|nr:hypothetical protein [Bacteroidales bacterium]